MVEHKTIYTIGYTCFPKDLKDPQAQIRSFISVLKEVAPHPVVIDVRSDPHSAYYDVFDKEALSNSLKRAEIYYRNYNAEFGARQTDTHYLGPEGYLDFEIFARSDVFRSGVKKVESATDQGYVFVLMCAEKDPLTCHRGILISRAFHEDGYDVVHILPNGEKETHEHLEERLLALNCTQIGFEELMNPSMNDENSIRQKAYRDQNRTMAKAYQEYHQKRMNNASSKGINEEE